MADPLLPLPEPFARAPRPLQGPGCRRGALIGCGVIIAIFGVAAVAMTLRANEMLIWILQRVETTVEAKLPPDLTPAERLRLTAAFDGLFQSLRARKFAPEGIQALQREIFAVSGDVDRGLTRQQILALTAALEMAAGSRAPRPGAAPPPAPAGTPPPRGTPVPTGLQV